MSSAHSPIFPSLYLRRSSFSNPSVALPTSHLILQALPLLLLRHSSFSNTSFASPTSQALHLRHLANRPCRRLAYLGGVRFVQLPGHRNLICGALTNSSGNLLVAFTDALWNSLWSGWHAFLSHYLLQHSIVSVILYDLPDLDCVALCRFCFTTSLTIDWAIFSKVEISRNDLLEKRLPRWKVTSVVCPIMWIIFYCDDSETESFLPLPQLKQMIP